MYEDDDTSWSFGIGLFIGAVAGAAIASLFTPRSGAQNREVVLEKGVVLKERVGGATAAVTTSVKDTTTSAVTSVKGATNTAVSKVSDTVSTVKEKAAAAAETVTETASSAVSKVSETASSTVEKLQDAASTAAERVSDVASTATEKVSTVASTAAERVSDVASTATEKARELTSRAQDTTPATIIPDTRGVVSEASYDAEDVRPATTSPLSDTAALASTESTGTSSLRNTSASTEPLQVLSSLDTFEPTMADITAATTIDPSTLALEETTAAASTTDVYNAQFAGGTTTPAELQSDEQFEVTDMEQDQAPQSGVDPTSTAGTHTDVREASEGAERGA